MVLRDLMGNGAALLLVLAVLATLGVVVYLAQRPQTVIYSETKVEADKRKQIGGSFMGTGVNFAW